MCLFLVRACSVLLCIDDVNRNKMSLVVLFICNLFNLLATQKILGGNRSARGLVFYVLMYSTKPTRNLQYNSLPLLAQAITRIIDKEGRDEQACTGCCLARSWAEQQRCANNRLVGRNTFPQFCHVLLSSYSDTGHPFYNKQRCTIGLWLSTRIHRPRETKSSQTFRTVPNEWWFEQQLTVAPPWTTALQQTNAPRRAERLEFVKGHRRPGFSQYLQQDPKMLNIMTEPCLEEENPDWLLFRQAY